MRLQPLQQWICDSCKEIILKPEDGWWEYLQDTKTDFISTFRIVHHRQSCMSDERALQQKNIIVGSLPLDNIVKSGGFGHMLHWLELTETKKLKGSFEITEFTEIMRRLYLAYWEEARLYWKQAFEDGFHDGCCFSENDLIPIIEEYSQ